MADASSRVLTSSCGTEARGPARAHTRGVRTPVRLLLGAGLVAGAVLGPAVPVLAAGTGTATVKTTAEAWYRSTPTCALPTGCVDLSTVAPSPYAPDTLHVGVNGGAEEARTYLQLDLAAIPGGTKPTGGTLLLPVAAGPQDGTRLPETAKLQACFVLDDVEEVDGAFTAPPEADCDTAAAPAVFVPAAGAAPAAFTVDLAPLAAVWQQSLPAGVLALVPAGPIAQSDTWHVAFSDRSRTGEGVSPITAALAFVSASVDTSGEAPPVVDAPAFAAPPAFDGGSSFDSGPATSFAAPSVVEGPALPAPVAQAAPAPVAAAPVSQVVPVAQSVVQQGFRYPGVFLLPLVLALGAGWIGRALTRDLTADRA